MALVNSNPGNPSTPLSGAGVTQAITLTAGGTTTIDFSAGDIIACTFGAGNTTIAFANIPTGRRITMMFIQDGVGSRVITAWPATAKFAAATAPTLSTGAGKRDSLTFVADGTNVYASNAIVLDVR